MVTIMIDKQISLQAAEEAQRTTLDALDKRGITEEFVALRLKQAMDAKMVKVFKGKDDDIIESRELVDHSTRLDALKFAATLRGMKPAERHDVTHHGDLQINIIDRFGEAKE